MAADLLGAFHHIEQTHRILGVHRLLEIETLAFILNLDPQDVPLHLETDAGRLDAGVTDDVGERLLDDAVSADLDLRRKPFSLHAGMLEIYLDACLRGKTIEEGEQAGDQSQIVQHPGAKFDRQGVDLRDQIFRQLLGLGDLAPDDAIQCKLRNAFQRDGQRSQALADFVV